MKVAIASFVSCLLLVSYVPAQVQPPGPPAALERDFPAGGKITMSLTSGAYTIRSGSESKVRVQWETRKPEQRNKVSVDFKVQGADATLVIHAASRSDFRAVIELPARTDVLARFHAGDLEVRGIEGNKDISGHAGDILIEAGSAADYSLADASVRAGDIEGPPFGVSKGGLFRSFQWKGKGKYTLRAHLGAGSITLLGTK